MGEIGPPVGDPLVNAGQDTLLLGVFRPVLGVLGRILALLDTFQVGLVAPIEAGVGDLLPVREGRKRRQPHVHAYNRTYRRQRLGLHLSRETGEPLAGARPGERHRLGRPLHWPVQNKRYRTDHLREDQPLTLQPHAIAILRVGDAIVATVALEPGKARLASARFHPT